MRPSLSVLVLAAALPALAGCASAQRQKYAFDPPFSVEDLQFRRSLDNIGSVLVGGNSATLLENGDGVFPAMLKDIREAKTSVNLETYIYKADEVGRQFADAMIEAARRGVQVRLMVDAQGSKLGKLREELEAAGVICKDYRPVFLVYPAFGRRTHRKLLIVDGRIAYTGGFCFDKRWLGDARDKTEWHDSAVRATGPVVAQLQAVFAEDWTFTTGEILAGDLFYPKIAPMGAMESHAVKSSKGEASSLPKMLYFMAIQAARRTIYVQNPYFLPDEQIREALIAAAGRGVGIQVMVPGAKQAASYARQRGPSVNREVDVAWEKWTGDRAAADSSSAGSGWTGRRELAKRPADTRRPSQVHSCDNGSDGERQDPADQSRRMGGHDTLAARRRHVIHGLKERFSFKEDPMSAAGEQNKIVPQYEMIHFIELQEIARLFESELIGRYVSNPDNLDKIRATVRAAMEQLSRLTRPANYKCPADWIHVMCRCVTPTMPFAQASVENIESLEAVGTRR